MSPLEHVRNLVRMNMDVSWSPEEVERMIAEAGDDEAALNRLVGKKPKTFEEGLGGKLKQVDFPAGYDLVIAGESRAGDLYFRRNREDWAPVPEEMVGKPLVAFDVLVRPSAAAREVASADAEIAMLREQLGASETERERLHEEKAKQAEEIARLKERNRELEITTEQFFQEGGVVAKCQYEQALSQLAAAESALAAEQALSEQMRAALHGAIQCLDTDKDLSDSYIFAGHTHPGIDAQRRALRACQAALALTPTDALRKRLLEVEENAFRAGMKASANKCGDPDSPLPLTEQLWQEYRRTLEEGK